MEYDFYLAAKYTLKGTVEAKILTAAEAEQLGYEDGYKEHGTNYRMYVDGFDSEAAIQTYLDDLVNCTVIQ